MSSGSEHGSGLAATGADEAQAEPNLAQRWAGFRKRPDGGYMHSTARVVKPEQVYLGLRCVVEPGVLLDATHAAVHVGEHCRIAAGATLAAAQHDSRSLPCVIGCDTLVDQGAQVLGAVVGMAVRVGEAACILPGARVCDFAQVHAGAVVPAGTSVPPGAHVYGNPGQLGLFTLPVSPMT